MTKNGKRISAKEDCPLLAVNELHQLLSMMRLLFIRGSLRKICNRSSNRSPDMRD